MLHHIPLGKNVWTEARPMRPRETGSLPHVSDICPQPLGHVAQSFPQIERLDRSPPLRYTSPARKGTSAGSLVFDKWTGRDGKPIGNP